MRPPLHVVDLGLIGYESAWNFQKKIFAMRSAGFIGDVLILNQHFPVYTLGRSGDDNHLLASREELRDSVEIFHTDRGGDVTYHGPGQIVAYPILDLNDRYRDAPRYIRDLEEVIIRALAEFGVAGRREPSYTGVWVGQEKIAAIGVKISRWITMHGFALNINTDLTYFDRIIPCGIFHRGVTSLEKLLGRNVLLENVKIAEKFGEVFDSELLTLPEDVLCPA